MNRLKDKVVIVTGAASGQGAAEAALFASEGAAVIATDINAERVRSVSAEISGEVCAIEHDVTRSEAWGEVVRVAIERFGGIDVLVNNAGLFEPKSLADTVEADLRRHLDINTVGAFLGMQAVMPTMLARGGGAIINVTSAAAVRGNSGIFSYGVSKWALRGLTKNAAIELAPMNIRVNAIVPGVIETPMLAMNGIEQLEEIRRLAPAGRLGSADEVAAAALFLASDEASYVMGAELAVCGALTA